MLKTQESKYDCTPEGKIVNRATHRVIPDDEPIFILRAQDRNAAAAIAAYMQTCQSADHRAVVKSRLIDFQTFALENPDRMKEPSAHMSDLAGSNLGR